MLPPLLRLLELERLLPLLILRVEEPLLLGLKLPDERLLLLRLLGL